MDCKVDRSQQAQHAQKAHHIEIGIVQDSDQPTDEISRGWGLSGQGHRRLHALKQVTSE